MRLLEKYISAKYLAKVINMFFLLYSVCVNFIRHTAMILLFTMCIHIYHLKHRKRMQIINNVISGKNIDYIDCKMFK